MTLFVCGDFNGVGSSLRIVGLVWSDNRIEEMVHEWISWYFWWFHASEGGVFVWRSIFYVCVISSPSQEIPILWVLFSDNSSGGGICVSVFINHNSINSFLVFFFNIGIRDISLGNLWSSFHVHISYG
jgi:hypothetical protein